MRNGKSKQTEAKPAPHMAEEQFKSLVGLWILRTLIAGAVMAAGYFLLDRLIGVPWWVLLILTIPGCGVAWVFTGLVPNVDISDPYHKRHSR
jgi:F0F1-type ATP synthase assembly protein I